MFKKLNLFVLILLIVGQTILAPISGISVIGAASNENEEEVNNENEIVVDEVDKTELETLLEDYEALELEDFTEVSVASLLEVVEEAEEIFEADEATEEEVEEIAEKLEKAIENLEMEEVTEESKADENNSVEEDIEKEVSSGQKSSSYENQANEEEEIKESDTVEEPKVSTFANDDSIATVSEKNGFHFSLSKLLDYNQQEVNEENPLEISSESQFFVEYEWRFDNDHGYETGDSVSFNLPPQLKVEQELTGVIEFDNTTMADYVVGTDGTITLTFSSLISELSEVSGTVLVLSKLDESKVEVEDGKIIIGPMEDGKEIKVPVKTDNQEAVISKQGVPIPPFSPNEIKWTIEVNTQQTKHAEGVIRDELPEGLSYKAGTLTIDGEEAVDPSVDGQTLSIDVGEFTGKKTIEFIAEIIDEDAGKFVNQAYFASKQTDEINTSASVDIKRGKPLDKTASNYDPKTRTIEWTVNLNFDNRVVDAQELVDSWDVDMTLVEDSLTLTKVTLDENGNPKSTGETLDVTIIESNNDGFKANIPRLDGPYQLTYKTKLTERVVDGNVNVKNKVNWENEEESAETNANPQLGWKGYNVDYSNQTITWTVAYNTDQQKMTNTNITDKIQQGMNLIGGVENIKVINLSNNEEVANAEIVYDEETETISVDIPGEINYEINLVYTVSYDYRALDELEQKKFSNTASIDWDENSGDPKEVTSEFWPNYETQIDGSKWGNYNPETKEITWTVITNYQQNEYDSLVVTDVLEGNQKLVENSITVSEVELSQWGSIETEKKREDVTLEINDDGFTVDLGATSKTHKIVYNTSLEGLSDIARQYKNIAYVTGDDNKITELPASVDITHGGNYVNKTGAQNGSLIDWSVTVNATQATLKDVTLTDTLNNNQEFIENSVKVYTTNPGTIHKAEELSEDKYTVTITGDDTQTLTITFSEQIDRTYIVEYSTIYFAGHQEEVENSVKVTGSNVTEENGYEDSSKVTIVQSGGGTGTGKVGYLKVEKVSNDGEPIEGVTFKLLDKNGQELRVGTSNEDGIIDFKRLRYGKYDLVEVETVEGFIQLDEPVEIEINQPYDANDPDSIQTVEVVNEKEVKALKIIKVDKETEDRLDGAEFDIQNADGEVVVSNVTTTDGEVIVDLEAGNYQLVETKAPKGYEQLTEPISFQIEEGKTAVVEVVVENEKTAAPGLCEEFEIRGKDEAGKEITSIVVKDADGEVVAESDTDSIILDREKVEAGTYTVEVTTEDGRSISEEIEVVYEEECKDAVVLTVPAPPAPELCEEFEIRGKDEAGKEITSIVVKDADGEVVAESDTDSIILDRETTEEGTYTVEVTTEDGRSISEEIEVVYEEECKDAIVLTVPAPELCEAFEIRAEDEAGKEITSIVVKDADGEVVAESDTDSIILDREKVEAGTYTVEVTTEDGRSISEEIEVVYEEECKDAVVLTVPAPPAPELCEEFEIRGKDEAGKEITSIVVKDADGEVVAESDKDSIILDRETTEEGTYTVEVTTEDGRSISEEIEVVYEEECKDAVVLTIPAPPVTPELCEEFEIRGEDEAGKEITSIVVKDADGEVVAESDTDSIILDRETVEEGTYTVEVTTEDGRSVTEEIEVLFEEECKDAVVIIVPKEPVDICEDVDITITENGKPSKDKEYTFTSEDGKNKVTIKTDENGKAKVDREKLPNGKYVVTDADGNEVGTVEVTDDCIVKLDFKVPSSDEPVIDKDTETPPTKTTDKGEDEDETVGGLLPNTATQVFNLLAIGLGILFAGLSIFFISRRGKEV